MAYFKIILTVVFIMNGVFPGLKYELIMLPVELRGRLSAALENKGITVSPSPRKLSRNLSEAGVALRCTSGYACADILILSQEVLPAESKNLTAIIVFPSVGFFNELRYSSLNSKLRDKIRTILYDLKNHKEG